MIIIAIPKILEDIRRFFCKNINAGLPQNFIKYETKKKRIPLPKKDIKIKAIIFISAIPLVMVMIL